MLEGKFMIRQGDCMELINSLPDNSVDMVLCDPPYGIDYQSRRRPTSKRKPKIKNDKTAFVDFIPLLRRVFRTDGTGSTMIFTRWDVQQEFINCMKASGFQVRNMLIWDKMSHGMGDLRRAYASRYESIIFSSDINFRFNGKRPQDIIQTPKIAASKLIHPNEKPVLLLETLISQCTKAGGVILDPFMGSGSTGVACANTGRNFIGFELDECYFEMAKSRIRHAYEKDGTKC